MGNPLLEVTEKPAVLIGYLGDVTPPFKAAVEEGLEEEGIPWRIEVCTTDNAAKEASRLAKESRINAGLVISASEKRAILHHRDLPEERALMVISGEELHTRALQILGRNAARLVKGNPFILKEFKGL